MPVKTIMTFILIGIVYLIVAAYKKVDTTVDEYKLKRNPDDIPILEKFLYKDIIAKNNDHAWELCNHILEIDPNNLLARIFQAILYHECEEYSNSEPILREIEPQLLDKHSTQQLTRSAFSITDGDKFDTAKNLLAKACYYNGHIYSINGQTEDAIKWKRKAKGIDLSVRDINLY